MKNILTLIFLLLTTVVYAGSVSFKGLSFKGLTASTTTDSVLVGGKLLPLGDSKTLGAGEAVRFAFRDHLQDLIGHGLYDFVGPFSDPASSGTYDVNHAGIQGQTTTQILARVSSLLTTYTSPTDPSDIWVIDAGTNDCWDNGNFGTLITLQQSTDNVHSMVTAIHAYNPRTAIYVNITSPIDVTAADACLAMLNPMIKADILALQATIPSVHTVNSYQKFLDHSGWQTDWIQTNPALNPNHPNDAGYTAEAAVLYDCMINPNRPYCDNH